MTPVRMSVTFLKSEEIEAFFGKDFQTFVNMKIPLHKLSLTLLVFVTIFIVATSGVSLEEDITITHNQRLVLNKFKDRVFRDLPHEYMKTDIYLIRWLRARNFDIEEARVMLLDNLKWRRETKMDSIHQEDWFDFESNYKYWSEGHDRSGRPIIFMNLGSWDVRKAVLTGQRDKLIRYIDRCVDEQAIIVRNEQAEGKNVSQYVFVVNLAGYNAIQQGCLQCVQFYIHLVLTYEQHFPNSADRIMLLNTPELFQVVLNAIRPFMSPGTQKALKVYGTNRRSWEPMVYKDIDRDELPKEIRGNKIYDD